MSENRFGVGLAPSYIVCDPRSRMFPAGWKDIWFRRRAVRDADGVPRYTCPICQAKFDHQLIDFLQGDHIWPYSLFGETSWENYQLICGSCNVSKSNFLDVEIRKALGSGSFRALITTFLWNRVEVGSLARNAVLESILSRSDLSATHP
jgi:hypothetical protein